MKRWIALPLLCILAFPSVSSAERILVQAETYSSYYNIYGGDIYSDEFRVYGLDYPGEWTEYLVSDVVVLGTRSVSVRVWGDLNVQYHIQVSVTPEDETVGQVIDIFFVGRGRCGS